MIPEDDNEQEKDNSPENSIPDIWDVYTGSKGKIGRLNEGLNEFLKGESSTNDQRSDNSEIIEKLDEFLKEIKKDSNED